jgi:hypothetical protein
VRLLACLLVDSILSIGSRDCARSTESGWIDRMAPSVTWVALVKILKIVAPRRLVGTGQQVFLPVLVSIMHHHERVQSDRQMNTLKTLVK